jgi:hypothetical protein
MRFKSAAQLDLAKRDQLQRYYAAFPYEKARAINSDRWPPRHSIQPKKLNETVHGFSALFQQWTTSSKGDFATV